jgi:hypothetical protein
MRTAHKRRRERSGRNNIIDKTGFAAQERMILDPADAGSDQGIHALPPQPETKSSQRIATT